MRDVFWSAFADEVEKVAAAAGSQIWMPRVMGWQRAAPRLANHGDDAAKIGVRQVKPKGYNKQNHAPDTDEVVREFRRGNMIRGTVPSVQQRPLDWSGGTTGGLKHPGNTPGWAP